MPTREEALVELYKRGELNEQQRAAVEELGRRGVLELPQPAQDPNQMIRSAERQASMDELAEEVGPLQAFLIGVGKGFYDVGRGLGLVDDADETEQQALQSLQRKHPISTTVGEAVGEAAPFLPAAMATGGLATLSARAAGTGAVGALEGWAVGEEDRGAGALLGGGIGAGAEILFPVVGKLGRKLFTRLTGKMPAGAMLDAAGKPTPELQKALDAEGITFDDLVADAREVIERQPSGADPAQVARATRAAEEGVPLTKGEMTRGSLQQATEQRLFQQVGDEASEPLRQFKLQQSEKIKERLTDLFPEGADKTETGEMLQKALSGRQNFLRTQKNELYQKAADNAKNYSDIPIIPDAMKEALPDQQTMRRIEILDEKGAEKLNRWLMEYGVIEPTEEMVEKGFEPRMLTLENFEEFRMGLNEISDSSNAIKVATGPIKNALDEEGTTLVQHLEGKGIPDEVIEPLRQARKTVREMKTQFSPQSVAGQLIGEKKDRFTQITDASQVYDKLMRKSVSPEDVGKVVSNVLKSDGGDQALHSLQATVLMDLIDAGFGTESRKISGKKVFNPTAFNRRLKSIGDDKLSKIFKNNKQALRRIKNMEGIARDLVPEGFAVPKGSAPVNLDIFAQLLTNKVPIVGTMVAGILKETAGGAKTRAATKGALEASPEVKQITNFVEDTFPGLASALGISAVAPEEESPQ